MRWGTELGTCIFFSSQTLNFKFFLLAVSELGAGPHRLLRMIVAHQNGPSGLLEPVNPKLVFTCHEALTYLLLLIIFVREE